MSGGRAGEPLNNGERDEELLISIERGDHLMTGRRGREPLMNGGWGASHEWSMVKSFHDRKKTSRTP
jgi:hypothetical protein